MRHSFFSITLADFIVRSAYQVGKTPLLPIFAASLGASGVLLGFVVSISTITGLLLKPFFGVLSDRWGRRLWLLIGTAFFTFIPFLYTFVQTPQHLVVIRLVHGLSTAIYGPVTLAYIAENTKGRIAESVGWFEMARSGGYIVGPALAGWLLLYTDAVTIFTLIGLISALAFIPIMRLEEQPRQKRKFPPIHQHVLVALKVGGQTPAIWLTGSLKMLTFVLLYMVKAFLPIYALEIGFSVVLVGLFFSAQEGSQILLKSIGGRFGDQRGHLASISVGIFLLSIGIWMLSVVQIGWQLMIASIALGASQAFIFPATVALISQQIQRQHLVRRWV